MRRSKAKAATVDDAASGLPESSFDPMDRLPGALALVGPDGGVVLKRPRPFVLAFSEWLTVGLQILGILFSSLAFYWVL